MKENKKTGKRYQLLREIVETLLLTAFMFIAVNVAVQNYDVDGPSMEPTLHNQERIMVDKVSYFFRSPTRGDVVVFVAPPHPSLNYVKRIIGVPGDEISIDGTTVVLNGVTLKETYVAPRYQGNPYRAISKMVVPADSYFVMGDDRANSSDSREWGFVPRKNIVGRATLIYWPPGNENVGLLQDYSSVFKDADLKGTKARYNSTSGIPNLTLCAVPTSFKVCSWYPLE